MVKCQKEGCNKVAKYGYLIDNIKKFCNIHRVLQPIKMIDLYKKLCPCGTRPCFGLITDKIATCCIKCKSDDMINIVSKLCPCGTQPSFGLLDDKKPTCCAKCKTDDMIDIKHNKCKCGKIPNFGIINGQPTCCSKCKIDGMIDLMHKLCSCGTQSQFGFIIDKKAICCAKCKKEGMIDLKSKKCKCGTIATFGLITDQNIICCSKCKTEDMIDLKHKVCSCGTQPIYGLLSDKIPTCCIKCKTDDMIDLLNKNKICKATDKNGEFYCNTRATSKYDNYCTHCFANLFPLDPRTPNIRKKTKEIAVRNYINANFEGFCHDEPLWTGNCDCTHRRRIDHRKLINGTLVCVGTDEFQHKGYDKYDEIIRYDDLYMIYSGKFIYIRFNPDPYKENDIKMDPPIEERLEALKKEIEKQIMRVENDENSELLEIIPMYYDR